MPDTEWETRRQMLQNRVKQSSLALMQHMGNPAAFKLLLDDVGLPDFAVIAGHQDRLPGLASMDEPA